MCIRDRAYHDFMHVREVLHHYADVAVGPGWTQPVEVYLAVLYHDAIYQPGRKDNDCLLYTSVRTVAVGFLPAAAVAVAVAGGGVVVGIVVVVVGA